MRDLFMLDPDIIFLNHGSFGACPQPTFDVYQEWQRRLERHPVKFLIRDLPRYLHEARQALGTFINADADDLALITNATVGVNIVARSLSLAEGDEVLTTDHEYGACDNIWEMLGGKRGFSVIKQHIPLPLTTPEAIVEQLWEGVTPRTKLIFVSHISSATAVRFPVEQICARARAEGILTLVDGAHAIGQLPLDMDAIDADFYTGNAHKWLMAPKGAAFLYTRRDKQPLVEPLVVSWGYHQNNPFAETGSQYVNYLEWIGTRDPAPMLTIPMSIAFFEENEWPRRQRECQELVGYWLKEMEELTGKTAVYPLNTPPADNYFYHQIAVAPLPKIGDLLGFKTKLYDEYQIEIPQTEWHDMQFLRISIQAYNTKSDIDSLLEAVRELLPQFAAEWWGV